MSMLPPLPCLHFGGLQELDPVLGGQDKVRWQKMDFRNEKKGQEGEIFGDASLKRVIRGGKLLRATAVAKLFDYLVHIRVPITKDV